MAGEASGGEGMTPTKLILAVVVVVPVLVWLATRTAVASAVERAVEKKFRDWEIRFSRLHERRVDVMEGVMDSLVAIRWALLAATDIAPPNDDAYVMKHLAKAASAGDKARQFFMARKYYLPKKSADRIEELLAKLQEAWAELYTGAEGLIRQGPAGGAPEKDLMRSGTESLRKEVPLLIEQIEVEFRDILGK